MEYNDAIKMLREVNADESNGESYMLWGHGDETSIAHTVNGVVVSTITSKSCEGIIIEAAKKRAVS